MYDLLLLKSWDGGILFLLFALNVKVNLLFSIFDKVFSFEVVLI